MEEEENQHEFAQSKHQWQLWDHLERRAKRVPWEAGSLCTYQQVWICTSVHQFLVLLLRMYWMIVLYVSKTGGVVPVKGKEGVGRRRHASMVTKSTRYTHSLQSAGGKHYQHIFTQNTHAYKQNGHQVHQILSLLAYAVHLALAQCTMQNSIIDIYTIIL